MCLDSPLETPILDHDSLPKEEKTSGRSLVRANSLTPSSKEMTCKKPVLAHFSIFIPMQEEFSSSSTSSTSSSVYDSPCLNHEFIQGVVANHRFAEDVPSSHEDNVLKEKGGFQINSNSLLSLPSETTRVAPPCSSPASPLTLLTGEERGIHGRSFLFRLLTPQ